MIKDPAVQEALESLEKKIKDEGSKKSSIVVKDRKIPPLDSSQDVLDWLSTVSTYVQSRFQSESDKIGFIFYRLDKQSKNELRFRLDISKSKATEVVEALSVLHCRQPTLTQLQQQFYSMEQRKDESIGEYAHNLIEILLKILDKAPDSLDKDYAMKSRFAEGICDSSLRL